MSWISESLTAKVVTALSLMFLLLGGSMATVYVQLQKQENDAEVINKTGMLRTVGQRIAKSALALGDEDASPQERADAREELKSMVRQFDEGLQTVYKGDPSRSIPPAPPSVAGQLGTLDSLWSRVRADADQVIGAEPGSEPYEEGLAGLEARNLDLLREADASVGLFEEASNDKITTLYWILAVLLGLGALAFVGIVVAMKRSLISPIQRLDEAARQVAGGTWRSASKRSPGTRSANLPIRLARWSGRSKRP